MPEKNRFGVIVSDEVDNVQVGDHAVLNNYKPCMECEACRQGESAVHYRLWEVIGTFGCGSSEFQTAANLLSNRNIDISPLVEDRMPLQELQQAFEKAATPDNFRVAVMIE